MEPWGLMEITRVQPAGLVVSPAFSHVAVVPGGATTIYVGGQNGVDDTGAVVSADVAEQSARALDNVSTALEAVGATLADVIQWTVLIAQDADLNAAYGAIAPHGSPARVPRRSSRRPGSPGSACRARTSRSARSPRCCPACSPADRGRPGRVRVTAPTPGRATVATARERPLRTAGGHPMTSSRTRRSTLARTAVALVGASVAIGLGGTAPATVSPAQGQVVWTLGERAAGPATS